jgi:hypothetical protein
MLVGLASGVSVAQSLSVASLFSVVREYLRVTNSATEVVSSVQWVFTALFGLSVLLVTFRVWRGARFESGLIDTVLLFAVLVSLLTPWYLLPALGLIALAGEVLHIEYLIVATCLGLLYYPLSVWAWFDAGISTFQVHLFQAVLLTLPILVLFAIKLVKVKRRASIVAV